MISIQDIRYALRTLRRSPAFSLIGIFTLALGIGATAAIFTLVNAVLLEPLAYPESDRLVSIEHSVPGLNSDWRWGLSVAGYFHFEGNTQSLEGIGVYVTSDQVVAGGDRAEHVTTASANAGLFDVLRARPALGRLFTREDNRPGGPQVAILSHDLWRTRFGSDPGVLGTTIRVEGYPHEVVGVLERGFGLPDSDEKLWLPLQLDPEAPAVNSHYLSAIGRLSDDASIPAAGSDLERLTGQLADLFPNAYPRSFMREARFGVEVGSLRERVVGDTDQVLWVLLAAVGLVLLIACANVANLFLVRMEGRRREVAIRSALGAGRSDLARRYLTESVTLALIAGVVGVGLAVGGLRVLLELAPSGIPRIEEVALGWRTFAFAGVVSALTGLALGLFPLVRMGVDLSALRAGARGTTAGRREHRVHGALVVAQIALALVLLASAGLLTRTFQSLRNVDPGLEPEGVLAIDVSLPLGGYDGYEAVNAFYRQMARRIEGLPGVRSVGATEVLPLEGRGACAAMFIEDDPPAEGDSPPCIAKAQVAPGYFEALGIHVDGRVPGWSDMEARTGGVVVTRALARRFWPGQDPIGKGIRGNGWGEPFYRVVGVAGDIRASGLDEPPIEAVFFPMIPIEGAPLWSPSHSMTLVVQTATGEPQALIGAVRQVARELDPGVALGEVRTMSQVVDASMSRVTFTVVLLGIAAAVALLLGTVGLYGVISYTVRRRRREIGIRRALGAGPRQVAGHVLRQSLTLAVVGVALGLGGALAVTRVLRSMLFGVSPTDPITLAAVSLLLILIAVIAAYGPARRATRVDPMMALRVE